MQDGKGTIREKSKHKNKAVARNPAMKTQNMLSKLDLALHPFNVQHLAFQWAPLEWHERQKMAEEWSQSAL